MSRNEVEVGDFLKRSKIPIEIEDNKKYKRVTIRIKHNGVSLRDIQVGKKIGTKKQFVLKSGQFILSKIDARYGAFGIAGADVDNAIITGNFWAYDVDETIVNIEWFNQYTNSPQFYELCERASSGITHRKYLDEGFFLGHRIALPTIHEQEQIIKKVKKQNANFLQLSDEQQHQSELLKKLKQQILQDAIQGKLVSQDPKDEPASVLLEKIRAQKEKLIKENKLKKSKPLPPIKEEEIPFNIPKNWVWCRLGELLLEIKYGTSKRCEYDSSKNSAVLRIPNVSSGKITADDLKYTNLSKKEINELRLESNDLLIIRSNGSRDLVGKTVLVSEEYAGFTYAGYLVRLRLSSDLINAEYVWRASTTPFFRDLIETPLRTTVGINNINSTEISNLKVPLPPFREQKRIVKKIEELLKVCDELEKEVKQNQNLTQQLLQSALQEALEPKVN